MRMQIASLAHEHWTSVWKFFPSQKRLLFTLDFGIVQTIHFEREEMILCFWARMPTRCAKLFTIFTIFVNRKSQLNSPPKAHHPLNTSRGEAETSRPSPICILNPRKLSIAFGIYYVRSLGFSSSPFKLYRPQRATACVCHVLFE